LSVEEAAEETAEVEEEEAAQGQATRPLQVSDSCPTNCCCE